MSCPLDDPEPLVELMNGEGLERDPNYARTVEPPIKECHLMDIGFRNMAGCPLNVYWQQPNTCGEEFKFHLGTDGYANDFHWDWQSPTKFESTKIGHTFVFRNPIDNSLVDLITLLPTQIVDCPDLKQKVALPVPIDGDVTADIGRRMPFGHADDIDNNSNNTTTIAPPNATNNTTLAAAGAAAAMRRGPGDRPRPRHPAFDSSFWSGASSSGGSSSF